MKKKLIIAIYKKENLASDAFIGIFLKDICSVPLFETKALLDRDDITLEDRLVNQITEIVQDYHHKIAISFFDEYEILKDRDNKRKWFFIKMEGYFDVKFVLEKIKF